jgi:predicted ArsR family transcriptional regulator
MKNLHSNQKRILDYLLDHPEGASLDEIAAHLGITKTGAREHVLKIEQLGFLHFADTTGTVGRPRRKYFLSPEGQEAFPKQYSWLSNVLLEFLSEDLGASGVNRIMRELANKVAGPLRERFAAAPTSADRLRLISETMNELGYRSSLKQSDVRKGAILEATNCVYHGIAKEHPELCQFDIQFLKNASGLDVKLEQCIARGDSVCRFCLRKGATRE